MNSDQKESISWNLTPKKHLLVACGIGFLSFIIFIFFWDMVADFLFPKDWNRGLIFMFAFLILISLPINIFDLLVPAKCPKCDGKMFGTSFRPPYKKCKKCNYLYEYKVFGKN